MAGESAARLDVVALHRLLGNRLRTIWPQLAALPLPELLAALMELLPSIAEEFGDAAATLASDWYEDAREKAEAPGRFAPILAPLPGLARFEALSRWGVDPIIKRDDPEAAKALIEGGMRRIVSNVHRETIMASAIADPAAKGWKRYGQGETCDFCRMLIGRGAVYTATSVRFKSHDNCACIAGPVWDESKRVELSQGFRRSARYSGQSREENNRRVREYLRSQRTT